MNECFEAQSCHTSKARGQASGIGGVVGGGQEQASQAEASRTTGKDRSGWQQDGAIAASTTHGEEMQF